MSFYSVSTVNTMSKQLIEIEKNILNKEYLLTKIYRKIGQLSLPVFLYSSCSFFILKNYLTLKLSLLSLSHNIAYLFISGISILSIFALSYFHRINDQFLLRKFEDTLGFIEFK